MGGDWHGAFGPRLEEIRGRVEGLHEIFDDEDSEVAKLLADVHWIDNLLSASRQEVDDLAEINSKLASSNQQGQADVRALRWEMVRLTTERDTVAEQRDHFKEAATRLRQADDLKSDFANQRTERWQHLARRLWKGEPTEADITVLEDHEARGLWPKPR